MSDFSFTRRTFLATSSAAALTLGAPIALAAEQTKIGFVYVGPVGDHGWTHGHDLGRKAVELMRTPRTDMDGDQRPDFGLGFRVVGDLGRRGELGSLGQKTVSGMQGIGARGPSPRGAGCPSRSDSSRRTSTIGWRGFRRR